MRERQTDTKTARIEPTVLLTPSLLCRLLIRGESLSPVRTHGVEINVHLLERGVSEKLGLCFGASLEPNDWFPASS